MFGDGAAAVVAVGERRAEQIRRRPGPTSSIRTAASTPNRCTSWAGTSAPLACSPCCLPELTGGDRAAPGRRRQSIPSRTRADQGATSAHGSAHPGGPKVIDAIGKSLELPPEALELTWRSLGEIAQPVVGLGAAHLARHHRQTAAQRKPRADDRDGSRILLRARATALALSRRYRRPVPAWDSARPGWRRGFAERAIVSLVLATSRASITVISVVAMTAPMQRCNPPLNGMNSCGAGLR